MTDVLIGVVIGVVLTTVLFARWCHAQNLCLRWSWRRGQGLWLWLGWRGPLVRMNERGETERGRFTW